jgi:hypothetical protein
VALLAEAPYRGIFFAAYSHLKAVIQPNTSFLEKWTVAQTACAIATMVTYPLDTVKRYAFLFIYDVRNAYFELFKPFFFTFVLFSFLFCRFAMKAGEYDQANMVYYQNKRMWHSILWILHERGFLAFYRGLSLQLIRTPLSAACLAHFDYMHNVELQHVRRSVEKRHQREESLV